ncbi:Predicted metal-dependent hydrolase, TIM-barrel fold [Shimia gijangensis]|uniref:Predicted metal-dependent hydrolase, TIM-barrel fold n=1 Tax=Shimia gijangensis TaxID=1470563 RepID=A0A1M6STG7_9RHOB|nr:amidohydrolase family protein [Shimia gijangensis]SHK48013.1 Predicted metal-dependent hydrolase, TIM-barrel fold [Shimia gijangensis]
MHQPTRIDVHAHIVPDFYREWCLNKDLDTENLKMPSWSKDKALGFMDQAGIKTSILSVSAPGVDIVDGIEATEMARRLNENSARVVTETPDRFGYFAILPQKDVDRALAEIAFAFDHLNAAGVVLRPHVEGIYIGEDSFAPVLAELNRRRAVVLLHPSELPNGAAPGIPAFMADFLLDTVRGAISLMRSGAMDRFPDLRVILSHAGGFLPFIASRIAGRVSPLEDEEDGYRLMRRFYLDTSLASSPTSLPSITAFADPDKLMVGTDFPFAPERRCNAFLNALAAFDGIDHEAVYHGNAELLFSGRS